MSYNIIKELKAIILNAVTKSGIQNITDLKTFDKDKIAMKGTSTGVNTISVANTSSTSYTNILPAKDGTIAMASDITGTNSGTNTGDNAANTSIAATKLDDFATPDDNTDLNANTTNHGLLLKATAPAAGLTNIVAIENGETVYKNKALFNATSPSTQAFGDSPAVGTATEAARQDHKHAMPATPTTITGQSGGSDLATNGTIKYTVPTTDGHCTGNKTNDFNCGYTSSAVGDLVYLDSSSTWQKADKGTSVATYGGFLAIALEVKASGNALLVALPGSFVYATGFPALTIGSPVNMDDVGAIVVAQPTTTDHVVRIVGYAVHADKIYFNPSADYIMYTA